MVLAFATALGGGIIRDVLIVPSTRPDSPYSPQPEPPKLSTTTSILFLPC
jgi:Glycine transporter